MDILAVSVTSTEELLLGGTRRTLHVRLVVNGEDLLELVRDAEKPYARVDRQKSVAGGYIGLPPAWVMPPSGHFLGQPEPDGAVDGKAFLFGCQCGEPGVHR